MGNGNWGMLWCPALDLQHVCHKHQFRVLPQIHLVAIGILVGQLIFTSSIF